MQFYPGDWRKDPAVACLSLPARGLWFEMLLLMHESPERGYLCYGTGTPISIEQLARMTGAPCAEVKRCVNEMDAAATFSRNEDGVIFCRRMVRDEKLCQIRRESGSKGGNPKLVQNYNSPGHLYLAKRTRDGAVKIGIAKDPSARVSKLRTTQADPYIELLRVFEVDDMANAEKACHSHFAQFRMDGEWFNLQKENLREIDRILTGFLKVNSTPSSSSSSSSSDITPIPPFEQQQSPPNGGGKAHWKKAKFDEFWKVVWLKVSKGTAQPAFERKAKTPELADQIIAAAKKQGPGIIRNAAKNGHTPIFPTTWLNGQRWLDEELPLIESYDMPDTDVYDKQWREERGL